jgi:hypothetical protein
MMNEINGTTESIQSPRRAVRLNAETLRALEAQPPAAQFSANTSVCSVTCTCTNPCPSHHVGCTTGCPQ